MIDTYGHDPMDQFYTKQPLKVDGVNLLHSYRIIKPRSEILATGQVSDYTQRFGDIIFQVQISFKSSYISRLVSEQSESLKQEMKEKAAKLCYDFL